MSRHSLVAPLVVAMLIAGCGSPSPTRGPAASTNDLPSGGPARAGWRAATVVLPDQLAFRAAASRSGVIVGHLTTWVVADEGTWMPADAVNAAGRQGIVAWQGRLVSWAEGGLVQTSPDGLTWSDAVSGPGESNPSTIVPFANQLFLLGEGVRRPIGAWRSFDGSTWTAIESAPPGMWAAAEMPRHGLVAVGWDGPAAVAWRTADGTAWERLRAPVPAGAETSAFHGVAAGAPGIVAIGDADGAAAVWSSQDLATWTRSPVAFGDHAYLGSIAIVRGTFVIVGRRHDRPAVWLSADGRTWSANDLPVAGDVRGEAVAVAADHDQIVIFGYATRDMVNGGSTRTGYLVWTFDQAR